MLLWGIWLPPDGQSIVYGNVDFRDKVTFLYNINLTTKEVSTLPGSRGLSRHACPRMENTLRL